MLIHALLLFAVASSSVPSSAPLPTASADTIPKKRTTFGVAIAPVAESFRPEQAGHPRGSNMTAWVKAAERSPLAYIQHGHDNAAWTNVHFQRLMLNAIKWAASPESKAWARANPKKIFA